MPDIVIGGLVGGILASVAGWLFDRFGSYGVVSKLFGLEGRKGEEFVLHELQRNPYFGREYARDDEGIELENGAVDMRSAA